MFTITICANNIDTTETAITSVTHLSEWTQSSGDTLPIRVISDTSCSYYTIDGCALANNSKGKLCYAKIDGKGCIKPTSILASCFEHRTKRELHYIEQMKKDNRLSIFSANSIKSMMVGRTYVRKSEYGFRIDTISFIDDSICVITNHFCNYISDAYNNIRTIYKYTIKPTAIPYEYLPKDTSLCFTLNLENTADSIIQLPIPEYKKLDFYNIDANNSYQFDEFGNPKRNGWIDGGYALPDDRWTPITYNYASVHSSYVPTFPYYNYAKNESMIWSFDTLQFYAEGPYLFVIMKVMDDKQKELVWWRRNFLECGAMDYSNDAYSWAEKRAAFVLMNVAFDKY